MAKLINRPVFLLGAHKSGSSLLRSLLDGHPMLFVVPFETHFFQAASYWVDYRLRKSRPPMRSYCSAKQAYFEIVKFYSSIADPTGDANLVGKFNLEIFKEKLDDIETETFPELISSYVSAAYTSLFGSELPEDLAIVEKSVEHAEFAADLKSMFPEARFVHILRNPYANLVACRRHIGKKGYPFLGRILLSLNNSYYYLYRNQRLLDNYLVIRYEDLITNPEVTMRTVADFLNITFVDLLLQPTSMGLPWRGNSSRGCSFSGIATANLNLWRADITPLEVL